MRRLFLASLVFLMACEGRLEGPAPLGGAGGNAALGGGVGGGGGAQQPVEPPCVPLTTGEPMPLRRLTRNEYDNTVRDLLGAAQPSGDALPQDEKTGLFLSNVSGSVSWSMLEQYGLLAETLTADVARVRAAVDACDPASVGETGCAERFVDQFGLRRDSDGIAFSAGATVQLNSALTAEISAGLQHRSYVDRSLQDINAPVVNAALIWSVSPLTTVRFNQQTGVIETAVPGSSGAFTDAATLEVQHDLLRNLSITVGGAYLSNTYDGVPIRERGYSATARFDYRFNRWLALRGSYIYSTLTSTVALSSYDAHTVLLGVRVNP